MKILVGMICGVCLLAGCAGTGAIIYTPTETVAELQVSFVDSSWDGTTIPVSGICKEGRGGGRSPSMRIGGIPSGADAIVVEFNDTGRPYLAEYGGHGAIWMATGGATELVIPSVQERSSELPAGVHMEHAHMAEGFGPGAYLAPCSLGMGHLYVAHIMAVRRQGPEGPLLLAEASLPLGLY